MRSVLWLNPFQCSGWRYSAPYLAMPCPKRISCSHNSIASSPATAFVFTGPPPAAGCSLPAWPHALTTDAYQDVRCALLVAPRRPPGLHRAPRTELSSYHPGVLRKMLSVYCSCGCLSASGTPVQAKQGSCIRDRCAP